MRLLVLGGTSFVGRAVVNEGLERGHELTLLNRGKSAPDPVGVRSLHADRNEPSSLSVLDGNEFDAVIDISGMCAAQVKATATRLEGSAARYAYVSTAGVYADWGLREGIDENSPLVEADPDDPSPPNMERYSEQKRGGELAALGAFGDARSLLVRPGVILGAHENVGRVPYWMGRISEGREVLAPGEPERPFAAVDVRDLAGWVLDALDGGLDGPYTVLAQAGRDTWGDWFNAIRDVTGSDARFTWVDDDFLVAQGVTPWSGLPLWLPGGARGLRTGKIESTGFSARPLMETVQSSWDWLRSLAEPPRALYRPSAMDRATEIRLLAAYAARP